MNCPNCGAENPDANVFCGNCGSRLNSNPVARPAEAQRVAPQSSPAPKPPPTGYYPQGYYAQKPPKDRSIALILEVLPGLFGFLGFGWIYSGNTGAGIVWLVGFFVWDVIAVIIAVITASLGLLCTIPISIILIAVSASSLNSYTRRNPRLFGP